MNHEAPRTNHPTATPTESASGVNQDPSVPEHPSVLVIEDGSGTSDMLVMALRFLGFDAHLVSMGAETIHEVRRRQPDAVLLDLTLSPWTAPAWTAPTSADGSAPRVSTPR